MYKINDDERNRQLKSIKTERLKLKHSIKLFNDDWSIDFPKNSLILLTAASGIGKTTVIRQMVKELIRNKKKALVFSNEELKASIYQKLLDSFMKEFPNKDENFVFDRILEYCYIIDLDDTGDLEYYDKVPALIMGSIEDFEPDVIFFDQISYCNFTNERRMKKPFEYLPEMVRKFKPYINSDDLYPPIVLVQQGDSTPGVVAGASNKEAKSTVNTPTHVVQIFREEKYTYLEILKCRTKTRKPYKRYTKFSYDNDLDLFDFVEEQDSYILPERRNRKRF